MEETPCPLGLIPVHVSHFPGPADTKVCVSEGKSQKLKLCVCPNATRPDRQLATVTRPVGEKAKPRRISARGPPSLLARGTLLAWLLALANRRHRRDITGGGQGPPVKRQD